MAMSARLTRVLQQQLGDELTKKLFTWMGQMESKAAELSEFHDEFLKFVGQANRRFDDIDKRFDLVGGRLDGLERRMDNVETRLDDLGTRYHEVDKGIQRLEGTIGSLDQRIGVKIESLKHEIETLIEKRSGQLIQWAFVFWCGSTFATVLAVVVTRAP